MVLTNVATINNTPPNKYPHKYRDSVNKKIIAPKQIEAIPQANFA